MTDRIPLNDPLIVEMLRRRSGRGSSEGLERETHAAIETAAERSRRPGIFGRWRPMAAMSSTMVAMVAVTVVVVVTLAGIGALNNAGGPGGVPTSSPVATPQAQPPSAPPEVPVGIPGLPPAGTIPSDDTPGELVLRFEPSNPWMTSWLFADGRLITWRYGSPPAGAGDEYIGLVEQRLTPDGVAFLTSEVLSTGLFESDLALLWEGAGFLNIDVWNGDRLVHLGWGHRTWGGAWVTAPTATPEQARALHALTDLLSTQANWPTSAWSVRLASAYVPPTYGICVRGTTAAVDVDRAWQLLPLAAQHLRTAANSVPDSSMGGTARSCSRLTTDDARALAQILAASGIERQEPRFSGEIWLRYALADPDVAGNEIWFAFCPVLPDGEAVWLGPG